MALFLVAAQAELTQTPFDMPVAESELVAGYMVEYTGFRFLFFFIGEFGTTFAFAAIAATLFLGGWAIPGLTGTWADILGPFVLFAKLMVVAFLMFSVQLRLPGLPRGPVAGGGLEVPHPHRLREPPGDRGVQGGLLMPPKLPHPKMPGLIGGLGVTFKTMLRPQRSRCSTHEEKTAGASPGVSSR